MKTTKEVLEQQREIIAELRKDLTIEEIYYNQQQVLNTFLLKIHQPPPNTTYH